MGNKVLGVGYSLANHDDHAFRTLGARLDEAEALAVDFVELPLHSMDLIAGGRVLPGPLRTVKGILAGRALRYTVHGPLAIDLMDAPARLARHQDVLKASLDVSAELGGVHYVLHGGIVDAGLGKAAEEELYAQQRDILAAFGEEAAQRGLLIVVENLFSAAHRRTALPSKLAREIAAVAHPNIWACLDFSHAAINCAAHGADFLSEAAALAPFAKHLHVHDSFGRPADLHIPRRSERLAYGEGDLHLPLGLGDLPWDMLMQRLDFPGGVIFNVELAPPYWSELKAVMEKARDLAARARTSGG